MTRSGVPGEVTGEAAPAVEAPTGPAEAVTAPLAAVQVSVPHTGRGGRFLGGPARVATGSRTMVRGVVTLVVTLVLVALAVLLYRHGVRTDAFPPVLPGTRRTLVTRYSPPWLTGAAAALLLAGLCVTWFSVQLVRSRWSERGLERGSQPASQQPASSARYRPMGAGDHEFRSAGDQKAP